jgi:hypothetical protein
VLLDTDLRPVEVDAGKLYTTKNKLGNIVSSFSYHMSKTDSAELGPSALHAVNREARTMFRNKYRLSIPVPTGTDDDDIQTLYISPQDDILWVVGGKSHGSDRCLVPFFTISWRTIPRVLASLT